MSERPPLPEGPYLVVGLARSGLAAARVLAAHGEVIGVDSGAPEGIEGIEAHLESDGVDLLDRVRTVVKSPGVPREVPVIATALERGIAVTGELEVAWRLLPNPFVAVTGTNGKTTTVELLGAMFRAAGMPVAVAGNVGTPLASLVGELDPAATVVCECSSFQLEDALAFRPDVAVLLNLEPDHLNRHGTMEAYTEAKMRIFAHQGAGDVALRPADLESVAVDPGALRLRGAHNLENARAAVAAATAAGVPGEAIREALATFPGVPNRLEEVAEIGGVAYVNDSKATNGASARRGLEAFPPDTVHAILGGSLKGSDFTELREPLARTGVAAYAIGEAEGELAKDLDGVVPLHRCGDLATALARASAAALPGHVVLLSPACASFDQYPDYEARGEHFRRLVRALEK